MSKIIEESISAINSIIFECEHESSKEMRTQKLNLLKGALDKLHEHVKRKELTLEGAGLGSWDMWLKTESVSFDRRWCKMLGLDFDSTAQELSTWELRIHPEDRAKVYRDINLYLEGKTRYYENIHRLQHADGHWVWILSRGRISEYDPNGKPLRFTGTHFEITAWREREIEKEVVTNSMCIGLVIQDENGAVENFNPVTLKILGMTEEQLLGRTSFLWKTIREDRSTYEQIDHPATVARRTGKTVTNKIMGIVLPSGEESWININAVPFESAVGRKVAITFVDITEQIQYNTEIKHIFNHTRDLMCIASVDGFIKKVSPSFQKILGWSEKELLRRPFSDFVHPDDLPALHKEIARLMQGFPTVNFDCRFFTHEGESLLFSWVCEADLVTGLMYATGRDVTQLRADEIKNKEVFDALERSAIVAFLNAKGRITSVNDNFCRLSGLSSAEVIEKEFTTFNSPSNALKISQEMWETISAGRSWTGDLEKIAKSGESYFVRTVITPLRAVDGKIEQFLSIGFDITEQKKAEAQLIEAQSIAKIGSWRYDFAKGTQTWSSEHYRIFEIPEPQSQEALFSLYRERIHPADKPMLDRFVERAMKFGEDFVYNHRIYLDEGRRIKHVRGIGKVTRDAKGNNIFMSGTCQDMTDLVNLREQNRFILDAMGIGIWQFNPVNQELHWDESMYELFDVNPDDFSGDYQAWEQTLSPEAKETAVKELKMALEGTKDFDTTFEIVTSRGVRKYIGGRGVVIRNEKREPIMMYGINWDRSKDVLLEQTIQEERSKSLHNAKLASLGEMSAGIAHEINNPLAIILGGLPLLNKYKNDSEKLAKKIEKISNAGNRIEKIVKGLRKFARSSEGAEHLPTSLSEIVSEALILTEAKAKRYFVPIEVVVLSNCNILCDSVEIEQVLVNLINNAIDAVRGASEKRVRVEIADDHGEALVRVTDWGHGISQDVEKKLFQPFFTTKPVGEGTGLGLSISRGIIDAHQGTLTLNKSQPQTCFEIRFPRARCSKKAAG